MKTSKLTLDSTLGIAAVACAVIGVWQTGKWLDRQFPEEAENDHFVDELGIVWPRLV
jgi:hypothetical protein